MSDISSLLEWGRITLSSCFEPNQAATESRILLSAALQVDKSYLYAWPEKTVSKTDQKTFENYIYRREQSEPIAYILGQKEFWSMIFKITPDVLIPRPETEHLIELILECYPQENDFSVLELGVGSGAISCALAQERSNWSITAVDVSKSALNIASDNIKSHHISNITLIQSNWFEQVPQHRYDLIVSNPPYVETNSKHINEEVRFEPALALFSGIDGLDAIRQIVKQAGTFLKSGGGLWLEHGFKQAASIRDILSHQDGFTNIKTYQDHNGLDRVTAAQRR